MVLHVLAELKFRPALGTFETFPWGNYAKALVFHLIR